MSKDPADTLRKANLEIDKYVAEVSQAGESPTTARQSMLVLGKINRMLLRISRCIEGVTRSALEAPEIALQLEMYLAKLKTLRGKLESLESSCRREKNRIEGIQGNVKAAGAWAASMREIS